MKAKGNGDMAQCVGNLLRLIRGEVPYERLKGLDPRLIDMPSSQAAQALLADAEWLIENYEPRADLQKIDLGAELSKIGHFRINADV
jgi:phage baseplate assembly protein W